VVLGLGTIVTNVYALVTFFLAGLRPNEGTAAPMFWAILAMLGVFLCARGTQSLRLSQLDRVRRMVQWSRIRRSWR